jgi:hypothetical protein
MRTNIRPPLPPAVCADTLIFVNLSASRLASATLLMGTLCYPLACQRPPASNLAVELPRQDGSSGYYVVVSEDGLTSTELPADSLRPLPNATNINPQFVLKLDFTVAHDRLTTTVYTLPPESDPLRYADGHKRRLGVHSARLNQSFELTELTQLGYQPFALKIVSSKPPPPVPPTIVSKVPSIHVDLVDQDLQGYTLSLRNISSSRAVLAYAIEQGQHSSLEHRSVGTHPVIAPGAASQQLILRPTPGGRMTPQEFVEEPVSNDIALAAAIFSDGSHEGDDQFAARLQTQRIAGEIQFQRLAPVIDRLVNDSTLDDATRTAQIREQLHNLSNQADEAALRSMTSQFPNLPRETVANDLRDGLDAARQNIWSSLYSHVHSSGTYPPPLHPRPIAEWWSRYRESR